MACRRVDAEFRRSCPNYENQHHRNFAVSLQVEEVPNRIKILTLFRLYQAIACLNVKRCIFLPIKALFIFSPKFIWLYKVLNELKVLLIYKSSILTFFKRKDGFSNWKKIVIFQSGKIILNAKQCNRLTIEIKPG